MPPKVTAGLARSRVRGYSLSPAPPANRTPRVSFMRSLQTPPPNLTRRVSGWLDGGKKQLMVAQSIRVAGEHRRGHFVYASENRGGKIGEAATNSAKFGRRCHEVSPGQGAWSGSGHYSARFSERNTLGLGRTVAEATVASRVAGPKLCQFRG